jgi:hypothetical protein
MNNSDTFVVVTACKFVSRFNVSGGEAVDWRFQGFWKSIRRLKEVHLTKLFRSMILHLRIAKVKQ